MAESFIKTSFAGGELSTNLYARVDLEKYNTGAALMRNFFVDYRGGASTRPGTKFISRAKTPNTTLVRLIPFVVAQIQAYVCEFGNLYVRFYSNGSQLTEVATAITGATKANPCVITDVAHGYANGNEVFLTGIGGMTQLNGKNFLVAGVTANTFQLQDLDGNNIDSTAYTAYTAGGTAARIYTLVSPFADTDLRLLKFVQSADVLTITRTGFAQVNLNRTGPNSFSLVTIAFGSSIAFPTGLVATPVTAGGYHYGYTVTAVNAAGTEESLESATVVATSVILDQTLGKVVALTWNVVSNAASYNVYKWGPIPVAVANNSVGGYIGSTTTLGFVDNNIAPDFSRTAPLAYNPFASANYPGCVTYFQQRRAYGALANNPESIVMSQTVNYDNFDKSLLPKASDSIYISLASREVNVVQFMVPMSSGLVAFTTGSAFLISGGGSASTAITPSNVTALPQASTGIHADVPPIVVNYDILFVQAKGSFVRDLAFNFYTNTFYGTDRSSLANHLFFGYQIKEWAWGEEPFKLVWAVRDDGKLLCLTFLPEQEVYGWSRHDTDGVFESVCTIPEGAEDAIYFVIKRTINGSPRRYIERLASRNFSSAVDAWCVDAGLQYVGAPVTTVSGLDHLVGKTVSICADGEVVPSVVVPANGTITLVQAASTITVGLGFQAQLQTLRLDRGEPTVQGSMKLPINMMIRVDKTRGLKGGIDFTYLNEVSEIPIAYTPPAALVSDDLYMLLPTDWSTDGVICIQQDYPLPATVLGIIPEWLRGDSGN